MRAIVPTAKGKIRGMLLIAGVLTFLIGIIPVRIAIAYYQAPRPQAILVLGGDIARMRFAVGLIEKNPELGVWVSDFRGAHAKNSAVFREEGIDLGRIQFDLRATDTVTNFTNNTGDFTRAGIRHLYLVTSDYHMARARAIATLVLGSQGIIVTPVSVPSTDYRAESSIKIIRDTLRSVLWLTTRRTGASFNPRLHS